MHSYTWLARHIRQLPAAPVVINLDPVLTKNVDASSVNRQVAAHGGWLLNKEFVGPAADDLTIPSWTIKFPSEEFATKFLQQFDQKATAERYELQF